jgi:PAS domain S-box-containing protein
MILRTAPHRAVLLSGTAMGLVLAIALALLAWAEREANSERVREHTVLMSRLFADHAARRFDAVSLAGATLEEMLAGGVDPDGVETRAALRQILVDLPYLRGVALIDRSGRVLASSDAAEVGIDVDLSAWGPWPAPGRNTVGPLTKARRLADLNPELARTVPPGVGFLPMLRTVYTSRGSEILLAALVNLGSLVNFQEVTLNDERMAAALLDYGGTLLAATRNVAPLPGAKLAGLAPFSQFLPDRESGDWIGTGLRTGAQIAAFRVTQTWPVAVIVEFDRTAANAQWWRASRARLSSGGLVLIVLAAMTLLASQSVRAREAARARVVAQEHELRVTLSALDELVFRCDAQGVLSYVNPAWVALAGGDSMGWVGQRVHDIVEAADRRALSALLEGPHRAGPRKAALRLRDAKGVVHHFECVLTPLDAETGGFVGSAVDVSERLRSREQLQAQLAFTELVLESSPLPMSVVGRDRRYRVVNRAWETFTGRRREDALGQPVGSHLPEAERHQHEVRDDEVYANGEPVRYEARIPDAAGSLRDVVIEKRPLPNPQGQADGILAVTVDVTEFREAERATREARDAAEESSRAKTEFVANMSHELRTPLQSIIGFSELGQRRADEQPRLRSMFDEIHASGQRMLALVNDLLDVSRIESSVGTCHLERADLRSPVRDVIAELQALAARRHLVIVDELPAYPLLASFDPLRLQQVIRNVVANAMRFSPENGRIEISADSVDGHWRLAIADRGPGIPSNEVETIFEAFVQSSRTKDGSGGTGLGLAICRTIMQAHGGSITARNREGGGSVFEIMLAARVDSEIRPMPM